MKDTDARPMAAPVLEVLRVTLMSRLGRSEAEAMGTPIRAALWDCCTWWESEGAVEFVSDADQELIAAAQAGDRLDDGGPAAALN
jgi:hypothetical protein